MDIIKLQKANKAYLEAWDICYQSIMNRETGMEEREHEWEDLVRIRNTREKMLDNCYADIEGGI